MREGGTTPLDISWDIFLGVYDFLILKTMDFTLFQYSEDGTETA